MAEEPNPALCMLGHLAEPFGAEAPTSCSKELEAQSNQERPNWRFVNHGQILLGFQLPKSHFGIRNHKPLRPNPTLSPGLLMRTNVNDLPRPFR